MNQSFDQDRVDRWLREAFHRDSERIVEQMPRNLLARCLQAVRAEAEHGTEIVWLLRALDGLAVAIGVLVVIGVVQWMRHQPMQTAETVPAPTARGQRLAHVAVPATNRPSSEFSRLQLAPAQPTVVRTEPPATQPRELITPRFTQQLALARSSATELNSGGTVPTGDQPLTPTAPARSSAAESGIVVGGPTEQMVKSWNLEPATSQGRGSGVILAHSGAPKPATSTVPPTVSGFMLHASDLEPQTTYNVLVKVRDQPQPVALGAVASDATGALHVDLNALPLAGALATGAGAPLLRAEDIVGVSVQDQQTGQVVLQTPPP